MTSNLVAATISLLIQVESGGDCRALGDHGKAVGILQIHPAMVQMVNHLAKTNYTLLDRWDPWRSVEMAEIFLGHVLVTRDVTDPRVLARYWNQPTTGRPAKSYLKRIDRCWKQKEFQ